MKEANKAIDVVVVLVIVLALAQFVIGYVGTFNAGSGQFATLYTLIVDLIPLGIIIGVLVLAYGWYKNR
jgi:magnesium-transporting ATPase (P-type)